MCSSFVTPTLSWVRTTRGFGNENEGREEKEDLVLFFFRTQKRGLGSFTYLLSVLRTVDTSRNVKTRG